MASTTVINRQTTASEDWSQWIRNTPLGQELKASRLAFSETLLQVVEELNEAGCLTEGFQSVSELVVSQNATITALAEELNVMKGRQAASAALQVIQFLLFAGYLITLAVNYVVKKCKKHSKKRGEEEVELLEQKLQERKSRRRAAARQSSADK